MSDGNTSAIFDELAAHARETAVLASIDSLLGWDERTYMPPGGGEHRAEQISLLAGLVHDRRTDPRLGEWLDQLAESGLAADPHSDAGATIRLMRRQYDRNTKLPKRLVEEMSRAEVKGQQAWDAARRAADFSKFLPALERIISLKKEQCEAWGYEDTRYDALLEDYEPFERTATIAPILEALRKDLVPLVVEIADSGRQAPLEIWQRIFPVTAQEELGRRAAEMIGFDFNAGRLDVAHHPFCATPGLGDCRLTTRYVERDFGMAFFSTLHEAGHGLYEQGLRADQFGLPPGTATSLGIHESQSRMWENQVGRSRAFWQYLLPEVKKLFPEALGDVSLDEFYFAANNVRPSLIRIEADEATYNLHIAIRFELEQAIFNDDLPAAELPAAWNERYEKYLGIRPGNDAEGVMQDIHWSAGLMGYFPTYSLGNLVSAQLYEQANAELGNLEEQFAAGEFAPLLEWLRMNVHQHGSCYSANELTDKITGRPLSHEPLIAYLRGKLAPLYELD